MMNIDESTAANSAASPEFVQRLGEITRHLHDTLSQLGVMPKLQMAAENLPDARSRLGYIARKSGEAADKVLTSVEHAKREQTQLAAAARSMATTLANGSLASADRAATIDLVAQVEATAASTNAHLTDIMLAQDFHDLTGQVVAKVVALAADLEDNLISLLVQAAPAGKTVPAVDQKVLLGPVIDTAVNTEVVVDQTEVDNLLASMGF
jgi:chemotaxis protein CheZ